MYRVFYRSCLWSRDVWDLSEHAEVNMADWNLVLCLEYELMNPWGYSEMKD